MIKKRRKRKSNQGNSFIVVVATISFLAVLVTALLVAVAMCFRLKAYDINSRDNFYYLEQAMDEIYEGVGAISMQHLNDAFDETAEVLVYYDTNTKSYVTMDNSDANKLMRATYLSKLQTETRFESSNITDTLKNMISNKYDEKTNSAGVKLEVKNNNVSWIGDVLIIKDIVLTREAQYSTVNTSKKSGKIAAANTFIQSITTDLAISVPDFEIDFAAVGNDISELYDFVLISDMGVEITGISTNSNITGNVYAAADFYNKEYNKNPSTGKVTEETTETRKLPLNNKVNSYSDSRLAKCDGVTENEYTHSMYSGFYVGGGKVSIMADKIIVPGSIAAMNCAKLNIIGSIEGSGATATKVWADSIILGGYSRKASASSTSYKGSSLKMRADSYVYDDLEVNADGSSFALEGAYYGYNYASTDNRVYSDEFIAASTNRKYTSNVKINDGNYIADDANAESGHLVGQAHYNSSSIVVNGEDSTLDLSNVSTMYIAGQAYVEMSKATTTNTYVAKEKDNKLELEAVTDATAADDSLEKIDVDTYSYEDKLDENYTLDKDGEKTSVQDYRTGEALSVKSNQLAYIPPYNVKQDVDGTLYVEWPTILTKTKYFKDVWKDLSKVPVIKTVVSGSEYYFYDFSQAKDGVTMNQYMERYAILFELPDGASHTTGDLANFYNIREYDAFKVENLIVDESKIYSNSAISVKRDGKITIKADSKSIDPLIEANNDLDGALKSTTTVSDTSSDSQKTFYAKKVTSGLQQQYKEMKMLLTDTSANSDAVSNAYTADEGSITPINYYFNFEGLNGITQSGGSNGNLNAKNTMDSGYVVFLGEDDVKVTADNVDGRVKGIVLCKGDVTFDSNVKEFEGLIVSGGKIIVEKSINFVSNPEIIKSVLRECDESRNLSGPKNLSAICKLFRHFISDNTSTPSDSSSNIESMKSVTAVQYEDILAFKNWKKNVD